MSYIERNHLEEYVYNGKVVITINSSLYEEYIKKLEEAGISFKRDEFSDDEIEFDVWETDRVMEIIDCPVTF